MKVQMELLSDTIFGSGISVPGGEDISVLHDENGFPFYRGSTFKGVFREEVINLLTWKGESDPRGKSDEFLGKSGEDRRDNSKLVFSDFTIPTAVQSLVLKEIGDNPDAVLDAFTHLRTFTALGEDGTVKDGSLRMARCVNQGITLEGTIQGPDELMPLVKETLGLIKAIGTMRNRGFGRVQMTAEEEV